MLVYRIILAKYADKLIASGRAARWNPNDVEMIYTASSRSLACLENVVHRSGKGLTQRIGEKWISENNTAVLQVPSSIVSEEVNYLLNPKHKDFGEIKIFNRQPFVFDSRIKA
ncbi:RES family NAD+ phosphorylase [Mucilaginibacter sp.]|uniref:RES family NAD+ phosphorylase n=1 Tax=Mucilaginibacter sp. TaxID=1882438 RepID=UPI0025FE97C6|nr:RES family NAD+ phosphorylase [Mucilaginibacter sp.]